MLKITVKNRWYLIILILLGLSFFACGKKLIKPEAAKETGPQIKVTEGLGIITEEDEDSKAELNIRGKTFKQISALENVYFDFDKYSIKPEAKEILAKNIEWLQKHPDREILITGHCDERGTVEYNLALGDKRAKAVRDYYYRSGIAFSRMATISYGKEKPLRPGHNEESWAKNRRTETLIKK